MSTDYRGAEVATTQGENPKVVYVREPRSWGRRILVFVGVVFLVIAGGLALAAANLLPSFIKNPFATDTVDRSGPVLVQEISGLNKLLSAEGKFQIVVDYEEDVRLVPEFLAGYHALLEVHGTVEAYVDLSKMTEDDIEISADGKGITITLPEPELSEVRLDVNATKFYVLNTGLVNRLEEFFNDDVQRQGDLYKIAVEKIETAAAQSNLLDFARERARVNVEGLLRSLGFERITINFAPNPQ
jgi:hypothetical protein